MWFRGMRSQLQGKRSFPRSLRNWADCDVNWVIVNLTCVTCAAVIVTVAMLEHPKASASPRPSSKVWNLVDELEFNDPAIRGDKDWVLPWAPIETIPLINASQSHRQYPSRVREYNKRYHHRNLFVKCDCTSVTLKL